MFYCLFCKYIPYPFLDNDIKYNKYTSSKHSIKELNSENSDIYNKIKKTGIMNYLNTIDQTNSLSDEIMKIKKRPKRDYFYTQCQKIEEKRKKNESLLFEKLYDKSRNKPIKKIQISNLNINDYNDSNRIVTDKSNQDTIEKTFSNPKPNYLRKNSKSQKFTIVVRNLDNHLKPTRLTKKTLKCLEPDKMPKMSMILYFAIKNYKNDFILLIFQSFHTIKLIEEIIPDSVYLNNDFFLFFFYNGLRNEIEDLCNCPNDNVSSQANYFYNYFRR